MLDNVAPALQALLARLIDYAGMFPPATLSRAAAIANYQRYRSSDHAWMLRWFVVNGTELEGIPRELDGALAVLSDADEQRAAVIESRRVNQATRPVYCEGTYRDLDAIHKAGCYAKIRTGGVKPEAIPGVDELAAFIVGCAERRLPFKATAGLHHPIRMVHPLTYDAQSPRACMHGFLNVFMAAAFAWHGERNLVPILTETDTTAFHFDASAHWRDQSLEASQVKAARRDFAHAFGSCSFEEPVKDLQDLGLL